MIDIQKIIELIERNPSIGKQTTPSDKVLMNEYHTELFGKPIADTGCGGCVLKALDKLRGYAGYNPLAIKVHKSVTKARLEECGTCEYRVIGGFIGIKDTCGPFMNKTEKTKEGLSLCGCVLSSKAKLNARWLNRLGGCPANKWKA